MIGDAVMRAVKVWSRGYQLHNSKIFGDGVSIKDK
jgi:hypothetical protein